MNSNKQHELINRAQRLSKLELQRQCGAMGLLLCILLPALLLFYFYSFDLSRMRRNELDYVRSAKQQLDVQLASYNRQLWREYGLWGADVISVNVNNLNPYAGEMSITGTKELFKPATLKEQILRQMQWRAPLLVGAEVSKRYGDLGKILGSLDGGVVKQALNTMDTSDPKQLLANPPAPEEAPTQETETGEKKPVELTDKQKEVALAPVSDLLQEVGSELVPMYEFAGVKADGNVLATNKIEQLTAWIDSVLQVRKMPVLDRLSIDEYALNYLPAQVNQQVTKTGKLQLTTPDGRYHSKLSAESPDICVERLIFSGDTAQAQKRVRYILYGCSFLLRLVENCSSVQNRQQKLVQASAICATVATLSLGTIWLEPHMLSYLLITLQSLQEAKSALDDLIAGKPFTFKELWPELKFYYRDFLRLLLLIPKEENLLSDLGKQINSRIGGNFYTKFLLEGQFNHHSLHLEKEYAQHGAINGE